MTYQEAISLFKKELNTLFPEEEVLILLSMVLDTSRAKLALNKEQVMSVHQVRTMDDALVALKQHVPIQYIMGYADFYGHRFKVNPAVLIPRPETEELVDWVIRSLKATTQLRIIDIGTGSGCIPISLKLAMPDATIAGVDISQGAIAVAQENARVIKANVSFMELDILSADLDDTYDVIISNPPYIALNEQNTMEAQVLDHEPHLALFVPDNAPLLFYRRIAELGLTALKPGGMLFFEINQALGRETVQLLSSLNYREIELKKDLQGNNRMIRARL